MTSSLQALSVCLSICARADADPVSLTALTTPGGRRGVYGRTFRRCDAYGLGAPSGNATA